MSAAHVSYLMGHWCDCCVCGVPIYGSKVNESARRGDHSTFYCINGHAQSFRGETEEQRLKKKLERVEQEKLWAEQDARVAKKDAKTAKHGAAIARGKLKAQSERIRSGLCPCCNRTFVELERHMKKIHPGWDGPELETEVTP